MRITILLCLSLCLLTPLASADTITLLSVQSEPGDFIGEGLTYVLTPDDGIFNTTSNAGSGVTVTLHDADYSMWWQIDFAAKNYAPLTVGDYPNAIRYPSPWLPDSNQVQVSANYRGCNVLTGDFEVRYLTWASPTQVQSFWAVVHQRCEGDGKPLLTVEIMYNLDQEVPVHTTTWGSLKSRYR